MKKNLNIEKRNVDTILDSIKTIERYQGESYYLFDDVGRAIYEIKCAISETIYHNN